MAYIPPQRREMHSLSPQQPNVVGTRSFGQQLDELNTSNYPPKENCNQYVLADLNRGIISDAVIISKIEATGNIMESLWGNVEEQARQCY